MSARGLSLCDHVLVLVAKAAPNAEAIVQTSEALHGHTRFAAGEITTAGDTSRMSVRLTLAFGKRHAKAETNQTDDAALRSLVERVAALAKLAPEDPEYLAVLGPKQFAHNARAFDESTANMGPEVRADAARAALAHAEANALVASGFYETLAEARTFATSAGLRAEHQATRAQLTMTMRTSDGNGSGWAGAEEVRAADIDAKELARIAVDKAISSHAPRKLEPGKYTVLLEPSAVANLLGFMIEALDARAADEGRSFFSKAGGGNRIGETILDPRIVLHSNPVDPATPGRPWDDDGLALTPTTWIEGGTLKNLHYTRFWAQKSGHLPTGEPNVHHLQGGIATPAALLRGIRRGLLVTRFWYSRWLDPQTITATGLTRDGVMLVEDGVVKGPVNNFRWNESPIKMLTRTVGMTSQTYRVPWWGGVMRVPAVCCEDFEMASVSDAI